VVFLSGSESVGFFIDCLYMYCRWRFSYQEGRLGIPLNRFNPPHFCACPKQGPGFPTSHVMVFLCSVIVHFVDIGGIDDHHCLNFLFITSCFSAKQQFSLVISFNYTAIPIYSL
jgi:hypothetical protein